MYKIGKYELGGELHLFIGINQWPRQEFGVGGSVRLEGNSGWCSFRRQQLIATGQPRVRLHTEHIMAEDDAQVYFAKDVTGKVTRLIPHQGRQNHKAERLK